LRVCGVWRRCQGVELTYRLSLIFHFTQSVDSVAHVRSLFSAASDAGVVETPELWRKLESELPYPSNPPPPSHRPNPKPN
jgi:hypothetical protein